MTTHLTCCYPFDAQVESMMAADTSSNHEYLPVLGLPGLQDAAVKLVLGADSPAISEGRAFGIQVCRKMKK